MVSDIPQWDDRSRPLALRDRLRRRIEAGAYPAGKRLPGERQLATEYGVCRWTVNQALQLLEKEGVLERFPRRGVFVRSTPAPRGICRRIVFVLPDEPIGDSTRGFIHWNRFLEFNSGLAEGARQNSLELSLLPVNRVPDLRSDSGVLAAVIVSTAGFGCSGTGDRYLRHLRKNRIPVIQIGPEPPAPGVNCIRCDRQAACRLGGDFLASAGFSRIVFLRSRLDARRSGLIRQRLTELGAAVDCREIQLAEEIDTAAAELRREFTAMKQLPELFYCDRMIYPLVLLRVAAEFGRIPGRDFQVLAFTCRTAMEHISPELGYLRIPYYEMGLSACELALRLDNDPDRVEFIELPVELVAFRSTTL